MAYVRAGKSMALNSCSFMLLTSITDRAKLTLRVMRGNVLSQYVPRYRIVHGANFASNGREQ